MGLTKTLAMWAVGVGFGCNALPVPPSTISKAKAAAMGGVDQDGRDLCETSGWYADFECDTFCPDTDQTCLSGGCFGLDTTACQSTEGCTRLLPPPIYNPSITQAPFIRQDPTDICRPNDACHHLDEATCRLKAGCEPVSGRRSQTFLYCRKQSPCASLNAADCSANDGCVAVQKSRVESTFVGCFAKPSDSPCFRLIDLKSCTDDNRCQPVQRQVLPACAQNTPCNLSVAFVFERCVSK